MRRDLYPHLLGLLTPLVIERAFGAPYLSTANWLRDFAAWPAARRADWQQGRLAEVLADAARDVPFYRELGATRLDDLPVISKADIRPQMDLFRPAGWQDIPHVAKRTGGTTGDPWQYPLDKRAWTHQYAAALHFYELTGYRYGEVMVLLGAPQSLGLDDRGLKTRLRRRIERHETRFAGYEIDRAASAARVKGAGALGAGLWYGFAGTIAAMADAVLEEGLEAMPPRAIVTTAEPLLPDWRERIQAAFGIAPFDQYGCNDGGILTQTCAYGRFHIAENVSIVEVLDGTRHVAPGEEGEVAVTNLHARVLPFLRYKTGDRAVLGDRECPCGATGPTLQAVAGRQVDRLELAGGVHLTGLSFGQVFMATPHVRRWQVVQERADRLTVRLDVESGFSAQEAEHIRRGFRERVGGQVAVELATDAPIERSGGGKHKLVVRAAA